MRPKKILVTGAGGDIGWSIARILNPLVGGKNIIGADINLNCGSRSLFSKFHQLPAVVNPEYLRELVKIFQLEMPELIIPMAEPELRFWHKQGHPDSFEGVPILYANQFALKVGFDKLATSRFLQDNELPYLKTEIASEAFESFALPCILKSRQGSGSKNLFVIRDEESLRFYATRNPTAILQQLVEGESEEYTCGVFRSPGCGTRSIIFRRKLQGGLTGSGEVVVSDSIRNLLESMAAKLDLRGSINVQLRMRGNTPLVFEINPRFSSTVMFRHKLGFKDLIWSIQDCFNEPVSDYAAPIGKITFFRGAEEVFYS